MVLWPEAAPLLRDMRDHMVRRVHRLEQMALNGRVNWHLFPEGRAYAAGRADAFVQACQILEDARVMPMPLDLAVLELVRQRIPIAAIAAACGCEIKDVAEILARHSRGDHEEPTDEEPT